METLTNTITNAIIHKIISPVFYINPNDPITQYYGEVYFKLREVYLPLSMMTFENFGINYVEFI